MNGEGLRLAVKGEDDMKGATEEIEEAEARKGNVRIRREIEKNMKEVSKGILFSVYHCSRVLCSFLYII